ncbi:HAD family hydrolase [Bacteroidota bacterium]
MKDIRVVGFDADDTLWKFEDYYRDTEKEFARLLGEYGEEEQVLEALFDTEMSNLELYGYGVKPFMISMIETAIHISENTINPGILSKILEMGRDMLKAPVVLLPEVKNVLDELHGKYKLIVATKGDLLDQEGKLKRSSLSTYFHHIEVMSDKTRSSYEELLRHLEIEPCQFVMIGNSLRSDILPPYELGCYAIYVPYEKTWQHEMDVEEIAEDERYYKVRELNEILNIIPH